MSFDLLKNWMAKSGGAPTLAAPTKDPSELKQEKDMAKEAAGDDDSGGGDGDGDEGLEKAGVAAAATGKVDPAAPVDKTPDAPRSDGDMERGGPVTRSELAAFKDKGPGAAMAKGGPGSGIKGHTSSGKPINATSPGWGGHGVQTANPHFSEEDHLDAAKVLRGGGDHEQAHDHEVAHAAMQYDRGANPASAAARTASQSASRADTFALPGVAYAEHVKAANEHAKAANATKGTALAQLHQRVAAGHHESAAKLSTKGGFHKQAEEHTAAAERMKSKGWSDFKKSEGATMGAGLQALEKFVKAIPGTTGDLGDSTSSAPMVSHPSGSGGIPGTDGANAGQGKSPHQLSEGTAELDEDQDVNGGLSQPGAEGGDLNEHIQDGKAPSPIRKAANGNVPQQGIPEIDTGKDSKISADDGPRGEMPSGEPGFATENGSGPANMPPHPNFPVGDAEQQATGLSADERKASLKKSGWLTADLPSTGDIETDGAREFQYRRFAAQAGNVPQTVQVSAAPRAQAQPIIAMSKSVNGIPWSNQSDLEVMAFQKSEDAGVRVDNTAMVNPLMKSMACKSCKSEMPAYLDKCPDCRAPVTGHKMEKSLALVVDVGASNARLQPPAGPEMVNLQHLFKA